MKNIYETSFCPLWLKSRQMLSPELMRVGAYNFCSLKKSLDLFGVNDLFAWTCVHVPGALWGQIPWKWTTTLVLGTKPRFSASALNCWPRQPPPHFFLFVCLFWTISHDVAQAGLSISILLPPICWIPGMYHHSQLLFSILNPAVCYAWPQRCCTH